MPSRTGRIRPEKRERVDIAGGEKKKRRKKA
jgi:hypothetical protein